MRRIDIRVRRSYTHPIATFGILLAAGIVAAVFFSIVAVVAIGAIRF
jgi:hypothetical protein